MENQWDGAIQLQSRDLLQLDHAFIRAFGLCFSGSIPLFCNTANQKLQPTMRLNELGCLRCWMGTGGSLHPLCTSVAISFNPHFFPSLSSFCYSEDGRWYSGRWWSSRLGRTRSQEIYPSISSSPDFIVLGPFCCPILKPGCRARWRKRQCKLGWRKR